MLRRCGRRYCAATFFTGLPSFRSSALQIANRRQTYIWWPNRLAAGSLTHQLHHWQHRMCVRALLILC